MSYPELPIKVQGLVYRKRAEKFEVLAVQRQERDGGFWQPITGTLELEETLHQALLREVREEIGVGAVKSINEELYRFSWKKKEYTVVELVYGVEIDPEAVIRLSEEHRAYEWCSFDRAEELYQMEENKVSLKKLREYLL